MLNRKMEEALNTHIQEEIFSSHLYLSMAAYSAHLNLKGFAHWMKLQSKEEMNHAMKLFDYIIERGGKALLGEIKQPPHDFQSVENMIEMTLKHERGVTAMINKLYELSFQEKDYPTQVMLQWFVKEQVEEEASISEIFEKLKMIEKKSSAILYLDKALGKRECKGA